MDADNEKFKERLETTHTFPGKYVFKFIVPRNMKKNIERILPDGVLSYRDSSKGNYISLSLKSIVKSNDEIIKVYKDVSEIEGVISL